MNDKTKTCYDRPIAKFEPSREELDDWNTKIDDLIKNADLDACMRTLACIVDEYDARNMDRLQCSIYHLALDWLATLKARLESANAKLGSFRIIEYGAGCGNSDGVLVRGTEHDMCMAYNTDVITDEEAEQVLSSGRQDMDPRVVVLWPGQARALFPALQERSEGNGEDKDK